MISRGYATQEHWETEHYLSRSMFLQGHLCYPLSFLYELIKCTNSVHILLSKTDVCLPAVMYLCVTKRPEIVFLSVIHFSWYPVTIKKGEKLQ